MASDPQPVILWMGDHRLLPRQGRYQPIVSSRGVPTAVSLHSLAFEASVPTLERLLSVGLLNRIWEFIIRLYSSGYSILRFTLYSVASSRGNLCHTCRAADTDH